MSAEGPTSPPGGTARDPLHNLCLADSVWVERYEGWTELGHGGSASVVKTHGKVLGEELALKIFPRLSEDDWKRFREEVRNALKLSSPQIVRTLSAFSRGSMAWIELELVEGPDLRHELERRMREKQPFSTEAALDIAIAVSQALVTAHEAGVTHRDVKPANILLPKGGSPAAKLGDFGISRLTGAARLTQTGLIVGTPQYAAPEIIAGRASGPAADVYSLTLCLYLALSNNRPPYDVRDDASPALWLRAHTDHTPLPVTRFNPSVPPAVAELLTRGLAKDPDRRPTAHQLLSELQALRGRGPAGSPQSPGPQRRFTHVGAAALGAVLTALAFFVWSQPVQAPKSNGPRAGLLDATPAPTAAPSTPPSSPADPSPSASASEVPPDPALRASVRDELVTVTNAGRDTWRELRVALVAGDGKRSWATAAGPLAPGEDLFLAFEDFVPPGSGRVRAVEVNGIGPSGARRSVTIRVR